MNVCSKTGQTMSMALYNEKTWPSLLSCKIVKHELKNTKIREQGQLTIKRY